MDSSIRKYVSRYVVPFYYDYENGGYAKIRKYYLSSEDTYNKSLGLPSGKWISKGFWTNYTSANDTQVEMDMYSYLPSVFSEEEKAGGKDVSNLGVSLVYNVTSGRLLKIIYNNGKEDGKKDIYISALGILILKNGIGFIWYESTFGTASVDEYVEFQNDFKELARHHDRGEELFGIKKGKNEIEPLYMGKWLSDVVSAEKLGIRFWAERESKTESGIIRVPDKALLYQYLFIEPCDESARNNLIFRIANGYDEKYNAPEDLDENLYKPFGNSCFYISKSGMACVTVNSGTNTKFFEETFPKKYETDYFFFYMLLAYQTYSCAHYSRLLTKLPADEAVFSKKSSFIDKLESLNAQINLFLVKSVFESVSNVHHQNGVYRYGKSVLCIDEDIQSLTVGLDALKDMEKDKRDEKVDFALVLFGLMVVVSATLDGLNLVDWIMNNRCGINVGHIAISTLIVGFTIYLLITLWINRKKK